MIDHYKVLGLNTDADSGAIRTAFRTLTKKFHPDRNEHRQEWATKQLKLVIEANHILSDKNLRAVYDRKCGILLQKEVAQAAKKYKKHTSPHGTQAERILDCLLNGKAKTAIAEYERLAQSREGFELSDHLPLRDWVDAKFLIAEYYERRSEHMKALALYESLYHDEKARLRTSHFTHEVSDRILKLCCRKIAPTLNPEEAARFFLRALAMDITKAKKAYIHKKLAECHLALGARDAAREQLAVAFKLKPDLKGATKICQRLEFDPALT